MMSSPIVQKAGIAALNAAAWIAPGLAGRASYEIFCTPPRSKPADDAERKLAEKLTPLFDTAEQITVRSPDTTVAAYRWRTQAAERRGQILLIHGWTAQAMVMGLFVKPLQSAGFDVVAVDLPGHGRSGGNRLSMVIGANAILALNEHAGPFAGIVTHSFGGLVAALAVEGGSPIHRQLPTERLVLIAAPNSLRIATKQFAHALGFSARLHQQLESEIEFRARRPIETITAGNLIKNSGANCLLIHDRDDEDVPFTEGEAIAQSLGARSALEHTTGLGHRRIVVMPHVIRRAVRFLSG